MNARERHRLLLQGLLGNEHVEQFATIPSFQYGIEMLARMLPSMVDGLAAAQAEDALDTARYMDLLRRGLSSGIVKPWPRVDFETHPEPRVCPCPDPLREVAPACPIHGHSPAESGR